MTLLSKDELVDAGIDKVAYICPILGAHIPAEQRLEKCERDQRAVHVVDELTYYAIHGADGTFLDFEFDRSMAIGMVLINQLTPHLVS